MILRFYFFTFYDHFRKKGWNEITWFRPMLLVNLTFIVIFNMILTSIDSPLTPELYRNYRPLLLPVGIGFSLFCYHTYVKGGKYLLIAEDPVVGASTDHFLRYEKSILITQYYT